MKNIKPILIQQLNAVAGIIIILAVHASAQFTKPVESGAAADQHPDQRNLFKNDRMKIKICFSGIGNNRIINICQ